MDVGKTILAKSKRKAASSYNKDALQKILSKPECLALTDAGRVLPPSHEVFKVIANLMLKEGCVVTPKHVHTIINNNRNGSKDHILAFFNIAVAKPVSVSEFSNNLSRSVEEHSNDASATSSSIVFQIVISAEKWQSIRPMEKIYGNRVYHKLRPGWSDVFAEAIWIQHHIDCVFSFKSNIVNLRAIAKQFLKFTGHCTECKAIINGTLLKEPAKAVDVVVMCRVEGTNFRQHSEKKRRHLKGGRRRKLADALIDGRKDAVVLRREEAGRLKKFGGKIPPMLPSTAVLRKAKEQRLLLKYGLKFSNPALNLLNSSRNGRCAGQIHFIGLLKFNCMYWTQEQLQIYSARCRKDTNVTFAIDATGGIAKRESVHEPHMFLYQCMLITNQGSVPVFQMVTADHRALNIAQFLRHILATDAPIPPIVVSDFGWALLIAVAEVFGKCSSFGDYLKRCFEAISFKKVTLPSTYIRLDVSHLIAMVARWNCLRGKEKILVRRFYLRCVAQIYQIATIQELTYFVESLLTVALSQYIDKNTSGDMLPSEGRIRFLNDIIKGMPIINEDEEGAEPDAEEDTEDPDESSVNEDWKSWSDQQLNAANKLAKKSSIGGVTLNACYNEDFAKRLHKYLLPYVAIWTGVMMPIFGRGTCISTSAAVESEFCDIKNRAFKGELPMRVDKFVLKHLNIIDDKITLASNVSDIDLTDQRKAQDLTLSPAHMTEMVSQSDISFSMEMDISSSTPNHKKKQEVDSDEQSVQSKPKMVESDTDSCCENRNKTFLKKMSTSDSETADKGNIPVQNEYVVCEAWGGLNKISKNDEIVDQTTSKRKKPTYLDNCPEWDFIKDSKIGRIPIFTNGNIASTVRLGDYNLNVRDTCAFDSIIQVIISGILGNRLYREQTIDSNCPIMQLCHNVIDEKKITAKHYKLRANILKDIPMFQIKQYTRKIRSLNAKCNAAHLAQIMLRSDPSYSYNVDCSCGYVNGNQYGLLDVNIDMVLRAGFQLMQEAINDNIPADRCCRQCKKTYADTVKHGSHLIIDTSVLTDDGYENQSTTVHTLGSIAKTVMIGPKSYILMGVVDYIKEKEHYIAYALSGVYWYCYDDQLKTRKSVNSTQKIKPHTIMYAICSNN